MIINIVNIITSIFGFLVSILIYRSADNISEVDDFLIYFQPIMFLIGVASTALTYNFVPHLISSSQLQKRLNHFAKIFSCTNVSAYIYVYYILDLKYLFLGELLLVFFGYLNLTIYTVLYQGKKELLKSVTINITTQMILILILLLGNIDLFRAYASATILVSTIYTLFTSNKIIHSGDKLFTIRQSVQLFLKSFIFLGTTMIFSLHNFLDVKFVLNSIPGELAILVLVQKIMITLSNFLIYDKFLKAPFETSCLRGNTLKNYFQSIALKCLWGLLGITLVLLFCGDYVFVIFDIQAENLSYYYVNILFLVPGMFFMLLSVFCIRYLKSVGLSFWEDVGLVLCWTLGYGLALLVYDRFITLAGAYSCAWLLTFVYLIMKVREKARDA